MTRRGATLAFVLCALVYGLAFQGSRPLADPDEGRYAQAAREILESGDPLVPTLDGRPHLTKPPGAYWITAAGLALVGENPWGARLGVGIAFAAWILCAAALGRRLGAFDPASAAWCAVVLATSALPFVGGTIVTADIFLAAVTGAAAVTAVRALEDPLHRRRSLHWTFAWLGLAFFVKGPPALLLLVALVAAWRWRVPDPAGRRVPLFDPLGAALFAAVGLWWYGFILGKYPGLYAGIVGDEAYRRLFTTELKRSGPVWLPAAVFVAGTLPWLPVTLARAKDLWRAFGDRPGFRLLAAWTAAGLAVFTISRGRMPLYVLPLMLPAAVAGGLAVARVTRARAGRTALAVGLAVLAGTALLAARANGDLAHGYRHSRDLALLVEQRADAAAGPVVLLQPAFLPGLAFQLRHELVTVAVDPWDERRPHDLAWVDLHGFVARFRDGVVAVGRPEVFERLPVAGFRVSGAAVDARTGLEVARIVASADPG